MSCRVALIRTDVLEELSASFIRVPRIGEQGTTSLVSNSPILVTLMKEALSSSETSVLTRAIWRNIPEGTILHSHHCENLKSYVVVLVFLWETLKQNSSKNGRRVYANVQMRA
jgi:hypothetical protein